jgi:hypothetical protein
LIEENGVTIANSAFAYGGGAGMRDIFAYEVARNLGLDNDTFGATNDLKNLMKLSGPYPTSITNIFPDGLAYCHLTTSQISRARAAKFAVNLAENEQYEYPTIHNTAPVITVPVDQSVHAQAPVELQATAIDNDIPPNTLTFGLVTGPSGVSVSPAGLITWTPTSTQTGMSQAVEVRVQDNGTPQLGCTNRFYISVYPTLSIRSVTASNGNINLAWSAISSKVYVVQYAPNLIANTWTNLVTNVVACGSTASTNDRLTVGVSNRFYRIVQTLP